MCHAEALADTNPRADLLKNPNEMEVMPISQSRANHLNEFTRRRVGVYRVTNLKSGGLL